MSGRECEVGWRVAGLVIGAAVGAKTVTLWACDGRGDRLEVKLGGVGGARAVNVGRRGLGWYKWRLWWWWWLVAVVPKPWRRFPASGRP